MYSSRLTTQLNFWAVIPLSLQEVSLRLAAGFDLEAPDFGREDSSEWFEGWGRGRIAFFVCREGDPNQPLRFIITPRPKDPDAFGTQLSTCLQHSISYGEVAYAGDERYSYSELHRYEPKEA